jgi:hypothetical protein
MLNKFNKFKYTDDYGIFSIDQLITDCCIEGFYFVVKQTPKVLDIIDPLKVSNNNGWDKIVDIIAYLKPSILNKKVDNNYLILKWAEQGFIEGVNKLINTAHVYRDVKDKNGNNFIDLLLENNIELINIMDILRSNIDIIDGRTFYIASNLTNEDVMI